MLGLFHGTAALADEALARSKGCMSCHSTEKKLVGPAYKEIAAKYKGQNGVTEKLSERIIKGSTGIWGQVPMQPNPAVRPDEAKKLVEWITNLK